MKKKLLSGFCLMLSGLSCSASHETDEFAQKEISEDGTMIFELPKAIKEAPAENDYATEVFMYAGCESNPSTVFVVSGQQNHDNCANLLAIAVRYEDSAYYKVEAEFDWHAKEPGVVSLNFPYGPHENLCQLYGLTDVFDNQEGKEPQTTVSTCVNNICPEQKHEDCQKQVCAEMVYVSVVNLEGTWLITGATFEPDASINPTQIGRRFEDHASGIQDGSVLGTAIRFGIADYFYQGTLTDRDHMQGEAIELMCNTTLGSWQAERVYP